LNGGSGFPAAKRTARADKIRGWKAAPTGIFQIPSKNFANYLHNIKPGEIRWQKKIFNPVNVIIIP
jgi:hypothetical protein